MQAVREVTEWEGDIQPNHTYLLDGDKMLAYMPKGSTSPVYFNKPMSIRLSGRKFEKLPSNPFSIQAPETRRRVEGSKGAIYWVDDSAGTCTCPGFVFRRACKHVSGNA